MFELPAEAGHLLDRARQFAEASLAGRGRRSGLDRAGWRAIAEFGAFGLAGNRGEPGEGRGALATVALLEGLGRGGADRSLLFAAGAHLFGCLAPFSIYATPAQAAAWGEQLRAGTVIGALAVTEAGGGSSLEHIETSVTATEGGYLINGRKTLIGNAPEAGLFLVLARQFPARGPFGLTAFLVPAGGSGMTVSPHATTAGLPGLPMGDVALSNCFVPTDSVLGKPGGGFRVFSSAMQWERSCILSGFLGAADRDLAMCLDVLRKREDSKGSLLRHQAVSHRIAGAKLRLDGARLLSYRAACRLDERRDDYAAAAMAKLAVSESVVAVAEDCLRLLAGSAWRGESPGVADALSDTLGGLFASGSSEIQLELLARSLQTEHREP
jgi:alkylation response protein AidB-like acyl-CoA dehydrogenase